MDFNQNMGGELGWNDTIQHDSEFEVLPEGDYTFEVTSFERGRHPGSDKLPPCNKAILTLRVQGNGHTGTIVHNLFLHTKTEGMICSFFVSIGQRKKGEALVMDWSKVVGATGMCKVTLRNWTGRDGQQMQSNQISKFYPPEEAPAATPGYTPGEF